MKLSLFLLFVGLCIVQWDFQITPALATSVFPEPDDDDDDDDDNDDDDPEDDDSPNADPNDDDDNDDDDEPEDPSEPSQPKQPGQPNQPEDEEEPEEPEEPEQPEPSQPSPPIQPAPSQPSPPIQPAPAQPNVPAQPQTGAQGYLGCYVDSPNRDLTGKMVTTGSNSNDNCRQTCQGFAYFGTQNTNECFCGNSYGKHGKAAENTCNQRCNGNNGQICGGTWRLSIYQTGSQAPQRPADLGTQGYIGCFVDKPNRDLTGRMVTTGSNTIQNCRQTCQGFPYFGTQNSNECFCGHSFGKHGRAQEHSCSARCNGNRSQVCGGFWRISIYRTQG
jgi:hypothetical protein